MASADPCRFRWEITNPFVPYTRLEAKFYSGSPISRQWKVILQPVSRSINKYDFLFALELVDTKESFMADRVIVRIYLNRIMRVSKDEPYTFQSDNRHTYYFDTTVEVRPGLPPHRLDIEVELVFRCFAVETRPVIGFFCNYQDLADLSESMRGLLDSLVFSDMKMQSMNPTSMIKVHYCILAARWESFLTEKCLHAPPDAVVETNISLTVLKYILHYMYSGTLDENLLDLDHLASRAELFQVIDRYRIYHLYKVYVRKDSEQVRKTKRKMTIHNNLLPLDDDSSQPLRDRPFTLLVGETGLYQVEFRIQFSLTGDTPSYSYSLRLIEGSICYFGIILELVRENPSRNLKDIITEHQCEYTINSESPVESGIIVFQNMFPDDLSERNRIENRHSIHCTLSTSDGTESVSIECSGNEEPENNLEELNTLSNHLYGLILRPEQTGAKLKVFCPHEIPDPRNPRERIATQLRFMIHRAILAARVPNWRFAFETIGDPQALEKRSFVRSGGFHHILEYMYTGKTCLIPNLFLNEVDQFAIRGHFQSLRRLVSGMRQYNRE